MSQDPPVAAAEFAALMAHFEPFEQRPHVAVAVSGGADSMALALLAAAWTGGRAGTATALTVDHRLRPESASEAARVGAALARLGIHHRVLVRTGDRPAANIEAAAREARYRLLEDWCGAEGVLHLLMAHHRDDQAETLLLRLARGSGLDGLAGMSAQVERRQCRILRPLLGLPRSRLAATVLAAGESWVEDPMNRDPAYARVRVRAGADLLAAEGLGPARLAGTAQRLARARAGLEPYIAALLARAVAVHPAGFAWLDPCPLATAPGETALRALAALLAAVGGQAFPPRLEGSEGLLREIEQGLKTARTLGGCVLVPHGNRLLVCREPAAMAGPVPAPPDTRTAWDGRFELVLAPDARQDLTLGALGRDRGPWFAQLAALPAPARESLPALRDADGVVAVPPLAYCRDGDAGGTLRWRPLRSLTGGAFVPA